MTAQNTSAHRRGAGTALDAGADGSVRNTARRMNSWAIAETPTATQNSMGPSDEGSVQVATEDISMER